MGSPADRTAEWLGRYVAAVPATADSHKRYSTASSSSSGCIVVSPPYSSPNAHCPPYPSLFHPPTAHRIPLSINSHCAPYPSFFQPPLHTITLSQTTPTAHPTPPNPPRLKLKTSHSLASHLKTSRLIYEWIPLLGDNYQY